MGKILAVSDVDYYNNLRWMHADEEAAKRGLLHRYACKMHKYSLFASNDQLINQDLALSEGPVNCVTFLLQ
jgi:hypothetical protein